MLSSSHISNTEHINFVNNDIILQQFFKLFHDDNTRLFGNFYIFSGMYEAGLNDPIPYCIIMSFNTINVLTRSQK